jgi:uncharacterized damage-inducible protein DinB
MAEQRTLTEMLNDLRQTQQAFLDILSRVDEDSLYRSPAGDSWTLAEVLVHISEARQFFTGEVQKVLATPGVKVGRTLTHPGRLQNIEDHGSDSLDTIHHKLVTSHAQMVQSLEQMAEADLQIKGNHVKYGPQTLAEFIQHFIVEHDQAHVQQATELLEKN